MEKYSCSHILAGSDNLLRSVLEPILHLSAHTCAVCALEILSQSYKLLCRKVLLRYVPSYYLACYGNRTKASRCSQQPTTPRPLSPHTQIMITSLSVTVMLPEFAVLHCAAGDPVGVSAGSALWFMCRAVLREYQQ